MESVNRDSFTGVLMSRLQYPHPTEVFVLKLLLRFNHIIGTKLTDNRARYALLNDFSFNVFFV